MKLAKIITGFLFFISGFLFASELFAQDTLKYENSLLWRVTGKKINNPSYLYGTIHLICKDDLMISDKIQKAFKSSKLLLLELNTNNTDLETVMIKHALMPDSIKLKNLISEEEYMEIWAFFEDTLGIPISMFESVKPMMTASLITETILNCDALSYEMKFTSMAKEKGMEIIGLETIEDQMDVINQVSFEDQALMLIESVLDYSISKIQINEMISAYKQENLGLLYELILKQSREMQEFDEKFLIKRNHKWISEIEPLIRKKSCFIAVGAAHLVGKDGLIHLLRERGFTVEAVK